ncbi:MAG: hypothetical protein NT116_06470 [Candidatus Parcubacteria bacterium]|nr:hypothetical protein [Candidatus Parcubacteria bacterium]
MRKALLSTKWQSLKERLVDIENNPNYQNKNRNKLVIMGVLVFCCGMIYLWQINGLATRGYQIKELEEKAAELKDTNQKLQIQITQLRSTSRLEEKVAQLNMVEVSRIEYLQANGSTVAMNR